MPIRKWAVWIILAAFVEIPHTLQAQLEVTTGYTATELANALAGTGVTISGATLVCANGASGMFDCVDCNVGLSDGVILTTGSAAGAVGPNNNTEISTNNGTAGDADLNALPGVSNTHDGCVLEFDITPVFDEISFEYVFGSDEYLEYVGPINDVFAFFISGPGIAGAVNIALVPGTSIPVGISTVNSTSYSAYYNNNGTGAGGVYSTDPYYIQYDGFTDVFTATQEVIPCETYHLKLAIGDEADHFVDSGVFLQANSLGGTDNIAFSYSGGPYCPTDPDPVPVPDPGATIGTFSSTPAGLVINTATGEIDIDASVPGTYTVTNTVVVPGYCDPLYYSVTITILEGPEVIIDPTDPVICTGESVELEAIATPSGGDCSPVTFSNLTDYAIPAGPTVSSPIAVSGISPLGFSTAMLESVCLNIDHTFDADLDISLQCPDGTTINLSSDNGGAGDDYTNTCFVVSGAPPVTSGSAPFTGSFTPEQPFSMLTGCTVNGTWNLVIDDDLAGDLGTLLDWSISFVCTNEIESYSWTPATGLSSTTDSLVDASPVTTTTYTVTVTETAGCATTATTTVTVTDAPTAGFVYSGSPYCTDEADPAPLLDAGASSGTWSSSPPGLVINAATGIVDLSLSAPGTYTITNAVTGPGACPDALETSTITISPSYAFTFTDEICSGDTYVLPDGSTTGSGGTYTANLITIDGCDSVITTILTEHTSTAVTEDVSLCDGTSYILPDGSSVGTAGTYISSLTSVFGCDSVITTNITIEPSFTTDLTEAICDGDTYTLPDGSTTTSSGIFSFTFVSAAGCDSIVTVDLTVNTVSSTTEDVSICDGGSYTLPDGTIATTDGTYISTLTSALGCDSIITTNLSVTDAYSITLSPSICDGDTYTLPDGSTTTSSGIFSFTFVSAAGCDSIVTVDLTVNASSSTTEDVSICDGGSYTLPDGTIATTDGTYTSTLTSASGCDSIITTNLSVTDAYSITLSPSICDGDTYTLPDGSTTGTGGIFSFTFVSAAGCDSIVTVDLTVNAISSTTEDVSICDGDTYTLPDGSTTGTGGIFSFTFVSAAGCDSIVTVDLTVNTVSSTTEDVSICDGGSYTLPDGTIATTDGTYISTLTSAFGCDSIITTNVTVTDAYSITLSPSICDGDTYTLPDGSTTTSSGIFSFTFVSAAGCDSIVTVDLTVNAVSTSIEDVSICDGGSYTLPDGTIATTDGTYISTLTSAFGCDSIITTNVTVTDAYSITLSPSICDGDVYILPDGSTTTSSGIFSFTFVSAAGCDSIVTVDLTVNAVSSTTEDVSICDGGSYTLPDGTIATTDGTYISTLTSAFGCDSIITTNVTVTDAYSITLSPSICDGDTYTLPDGSTTGTGGIFSFTFVSAAGCDSIVTVDLTVNAVSSTTEDVSICDGGSYTLPDGTIATTDGTYTSTLTSASGCDSIITTNLSVTDAYSITLSPSICDGDTYTLPDGSTTTSSGIFSFTFVSAAGCDSIVTVDLTVNAISSTTEDVSICDGGSYTLPDGTIATTDGTYISTLTSALGCDSIITTNVAVTDAYSITLSPSICDGDTYTLPDGSTTTSSGIFSFTFVSAAGCDSIVTVDLTVNAASTSTEDVSICDGGSYTLPDGTIATTDGTYTSTLTSASGCDSIITTNLSVTDAYSITLSPSICDGDTYTLPDGSTTTSSGIFSFTFVSAAGCDSIVTVDLTVNAISSATEDVSICDGGSYSLPDGTIATTDGTYISTLISASGCDSIITTNVTVTDAYSITLSPSICDGDTYTLPDGSTTTSSGIFSFTFVSAAGCDSIVTVDLTVNAISSATEDVSICEGGSYLLPDGTAVSAAGVYVTTLSGADGCDSTITTTVSVTDAYLISLSPGICSGEVYTLPDGSLTDTAGVYSYTFISAAGCDSIVTVSLSVNEVYENIIPYSLCDDATIILPDGSVVYDPPAGLYTYTFTSAAGCDSVVGVDLSILPVYDLVLEAQICESAFYTLPDGSSTGTAGTYVFDLTTASGCDSSVTVNLEVLPELTTDITAAICDGESYVLPDGSSADVSGVYAYTFTSVAGCDSVVTIDLTVNPVYENIIPYAICDDETIVLPDGSVVYDPPAGVYTYTFVSSSGCDSVVGVDLTVYPIYDEVINEEICSGSSYILPDGTSTGTSGSWVFDLSTITGCDSVITVNLEVLPVFESTYLASICDGDVYVLPDGSVTTVGGTYTFTYSTASGCDSIVHIELNVMPLPVVDVWMDASGYCMDAGWQAVGMEPVGGVLGGTGISADGFDPMLAGAGGPYDIWYIYTDASGCADTAWTTISAWTVPAPELLLPEGVCIEADPIPLNGIPAGGIYSGTGVVGTDFLASVAGEGPAWVSYTFTDANGCSAAITVPVEVWENTVDAGVDLILVAGNSIQLLVEGTGLINWSPGTGLSCADCYEPVAFPLQTTTYVVTEFDEHGCFATDNLTIFVEDLNDYTFFAPNTFTPNGDGQNDYFFINGFHLEQIVYLHIYDRWGEPVFDRENLNPGVEQEGWDGKFAGMPVNAGVYAWVAEILLANGERIMKYGNITLVR